MIASPGKIDIQTLWSMYERAVESMLPHAASGGCVPSPRNDSVASLRIAVEK